MSEPLLTKRLHISGLTPSITPADLERRLSSFGVVKAMDGFGARDALGDPRKFGFVTMEIGAKELAKCLNMLSGSTWKGAKLRIGEAKPDFPERLANINSQPPRPLRPKRTRVRDYGHPSSILPLAPLSAIAAASTPGWIATPSGRVVRPMRMRPGRPLEPMYNETSASKEKGVNRKVKKRIKPTPVRARRRLIDPTKWDSVYLKGMFLDSIPLPLPTPDNELDPSGSVKRGTVDEEDEEEIGSDVLSTASPPAPEFVPDPPPRLQQSSAPGATVVSSLQIDDDPEPFNIREEANTALTMLCEMFVDKEDWDGRESVDEMESLSDNEGRGGGMQVDEMDHIEIVPRESDKRRKVTRSDLGKGEEKLAGAIVRFGNEDDRAGPGPEKDVEMAGINPSINVKLSKQAMEYAPQISLKALFAPKEEASFSLLNHFDLDLDLDLDADILGIGIPSDVPQENRPFAKPTLPTHHVVEIPAATKVRTRVALDPSLPLLFPLPDTLPHPYTSSNLTTTERNNGTPSCILFPSAARVRGLHSLPSSVTFTRSSQDTPESIRGRWEKDKSSLTREWKKAWRDARGSRRGKGGTGDEIGGSY